MGKQSGLSGLFDDMLLKNGSSRALFGWLFAIVVGTLIIYGVNVVAPGTVPSEFSPLAMVLSAAGGGGGSNTQVSVQGQGILQQVTTVDIQTAVTESIADTTGVKNRIGGTVDWYYDGVPSYFEETTLSTSGYSASTTDPAPGSKVVGIFTNSSYYHAKLANTDGTALEVPLAQAMQVTAEADLLQTVNITCQNSTSGNWQATDVNQSLTTDEAVTLTCKLTGKVARGVFKGPIVIGLNYSTNNFTDSGTYIVGATKTDVPSGVMNGFESAWLTNIPDIEDFEDQTFQVRITPASGQNPSDYRVNLRVVDCGATYTKSEWPVLFTGCQNGDTLAAIGSTDQTFSIWVD